jgi:hypothetical protein
MRIRTLMRVIILLALVSAIGHEIETQVRWDETVAIPFYGADRVLPVGTTPTMFFMGE